MSRSLLCLGAVLFLLLEVSCASMDASKRESAVSRQAYAEALVTLEADPVAGTLALEKFLKDFPRSTFADDAGYRLARLSLERGERDQAKVRLAWVVSTYMLGDKAQSARFLLARIEAEEGDLERAYRHASHLEFSRLVIEDRWRAFQFLANLSKQRAEVVDELVWLERSRSLIRQGERLEGIDARIETLLGEETDDEVLERAAQRIGANPIHARIRLRQVELALLRQERKRAERILDGLSRQRLASAEDLERARLETRLKGSQPTETLPYFDELLDRPSPEISGASGKVGVVLPLSGPSASLGEASLRGILLAADIFEEQSSLGSVELEIRDTRGKPDVVEAAVAQLAEQPAVTAIIGPLFSKEAKAASYAAQMASIPLLSLSFREEVARDYPYVFRLGVTSRARMEILSDYVVNKLELKRFAILYPRDQYGRALKKQFWEALEGRGGEVVGLGSYDPDANDFGVPIRTMIGYLLLTPEEHELLRERKEMLQRAKRLPPEEALVLRDEAKLLMTEEGDLLPPIVDFDAVFIVDGYQKVTLIAPQLEYNEVEDVILLGANGWNHPELLTLERKHVEGAVFTEGFFAESEVPVVKKFAQRYRETYGIEPDMLAAQAFDAMNLLLLEMVNPRPTRDQVRDALLRIENYPGASGVTTIRADGNADKRPFLLMVQRGRILAAPKDPEPVPPREPIVFEPKVEEPVIE